MPASTLQSGSQTSSEVDLREGYGDPDAGTMAPVLEAVRELAPVIATRAGDIEAARRLPRDLLDDLVAAGCFRMLRPTSHGGMGLGLASGMRVIEELSRADASVAWTVGIGSAGWLDLVDLPRRTFDAIFGENPDAIVAGAVNPTGTAVPVDGGYRISGRWAFASGCEHSDWMFANCIEQPPDGDGEGGAAGEPPAVDGGMPPMRVAAVSPADVEIEDTWSVSGLRGTGSHHFRIEGVVVPADHTYAVMADESCVDEPMARIPLPTPYTLLLAGMAIGVARGALDDILALAATKVPLFAGSTLASDPLFQNRLASADAQLRAARALVYDDAATVWRMAVAGEELPLELRARIRADGVWAASTAASVVDTAYTAGGSSSLYDSSPLQRRLRDIHAMTQHFLVKADALTPVGAVLAGQDIDVPFL
ncbi:MAG TPA: acyl-CoA dehydrogenase family protein [Acidimicrobiales bacterium]|nr:acyl-CoA dehydrogenase family protein [Acidimicrobiales bacterium]